MSKIKAAAIPVVGIFEKVLASSKTKVKPYLEMTDEELIKSVQKGEEDAFRFIVDRYQGKMFAYIMRLINHRDEAHDITQDVFLKTYKYLHRFDTERKFSSWIYRIAHNESVNWLKKKTRVKVESLDKHVEDYGLQLASSSNIEEQYVKAEVQNEVREAIDKLPEKYREVMILRYLEEQSYEEIGEHLNKPVNTIGTIINRAKKKLAQEIAIPL